MKNKIINCLKSLGFTLVSDETADQKIFVHDTILVSVEEQNPQNK